MTDVELYHNDYENKWCPGCGNFGILEAMKDALAGLDIPPSKALIVSGIGQAGKTPHFLKCNFFHGLHGRALPVATGAKMANNDMTVLVNTGDGDCYGEGGNHFLAAVRRNVDITALVHNNKVYGLTKGQASPTSDMGMTTKVQGKGVILSPFDGPSVALSLGAGFVARGFAGRMDHLSGLIQAAIRYSGFALIDIFQPCVSFNRRNTWQSYNESVYELTEENHDPADLDAAFKLCRQGDEKIPIGIFYQKETVSFSDRIEVLREGPLVSRTFAPARVQNLLNTY